MRTVKITTTTTLTVGLGVGELNPNDAELLKHDQQNDGEVVLHEGLLSLMRNSGKMTSTFEEVK